MSKELDVNEIVEELDVLVRKCEALNEAKVGLNRYDGLCYGELRTVDLFDVTEQMNHMLGVYSKQIKTNKEILGCLTSRDWNNATGKTSLILYNRINIED